MNQSRNILPLLNFERNNCTFFYILCFFRYRNTTVKSRLREKDNSSGETLSKNGFRRPCGLNPAPDGGFQKLKYIFKLIFSLRSGLEPHLATASFQARGQEKTVFFISRACFFVDWIYIMTSLSRRGARMAKGAVCKTVSCGFNSHPRLHFLPQNPNLLFWLIFHFCM